MSQRFLPRTQYHHFPLQNDFDDTNSVLAKDRRLNACRPDTINDSTNDLPVSSRSKMRSDIRCVAYHRLYIVLYSKTYI